MATTATTPRRQSCDRCYGQKLRCTRAGNSDTDACIRCLRHGAECVYSSSLPKGRPSMYRLADRSSESSDLPPPAAVRVKRPRQNSRAVTSNARFNVSLSASTADKADRSATVAPEPSPSTGKKNAKSRPNTDTNADSSMNLHSTANQGSVLPASMNSSAAMWSYLPQSNLHGMERYGDEHDWTAGMLNLPGQQMDTGLGFLDTGPGLLPWENSDCFGPGSELFMTADSGSDTVADKNSPDVGISQLSQLSNRLCSLHHWSCAVAGDAESAFQSGNPAQSSQSPLINDVAFQSVASWLVHVSADMNIFPCIDPRPSTLEQSSTNNTLHDVFSASYQFMETLRGLQNESASDGHAGMSPDSWTNNTTHDMQLQPSENPYSSIIERHLVIACHTLLLKIYVAVFTSLQRDVDRCSSPRPVSGKADRDATVDAASLADMRLVLVVQLCSYILERQHQAVSSYLAPESPPAQSQQFEIPFFSQPTAIQGVESGPGSEVQRRLGRLRESLRI